MNNTNNNSQKKLTTSIFFFNFLYRHAAFDNVQLRTTTIFHKNIVSFSVSDSVSFSELVLSIESFCEITINLCHGGSSVYRIEIPLASVSNGLLD